MKAPLAVDALVVGAGPAGTGAALRLLQLGYRVAVIERHDTPRGNVGESLTPGVHNILELLGASETVAGVPQRAGLPTRLLWSTHDAQLHAGGNLVVDRGAFDRALLDLARERGAHCFTSAQVIALEHEAGAWRTAVRTDGDDDVRCIAAQWMLDAGGRPPPGRADVIAAAPPLLALWLDYDSAHAGPETRIEALADGWLWGSPLAHGRYRAMVFCDPATPRLAQARTRELWFRTVLSRSRLLAPLATAPAVTALQACSAGACLTADTQQPCRLALGDAAFALDPLSASGVEKAMRFSLQAVTALHTAQRHPERQSLALAFYRSRRVESLARHLRWTREFYAQAWPQREHGFWQRQSAAFEPDHADLRAALADMRTVESPRIAGIANLDEVLRAPVTLSSASRFVELPCVVDDCVELRPALDHPALERPLAWLDGVEIAPLLAGVAQAGNLAQLIDTWAQHVPRRTATRIAGWLLQKGVVCWS